MCVLFFKRELQLFKRVRYYFFNWFNFCLMEYTNLIIITMKKLLILLLMSLSVMVSAQLTKEAIYCRDSDDKELRDIYVNIYVQAHHEFSANRIVMISKINDQIYAFLSMAILDKQEPMFCEMCIDKYTTKDTKLTNWEHAKRCVLETILEIRTGH